jgi:hypothetical protein
MFGSIVEIFRPDRDLSTLLHRFAFGHLDC